MRNEPYDSVEYRGYTINIYQDENSESPREWDNAGTMICSHSRYNLGDEQIQGRDDMLERMSGLSFDDFEDKDYDEIRAWI